MSGAIIDVHVRLSAGAPLTSAELAAAARQVGLDGMVVVGHDLPPAAEGGVVDGVLICCGVELDSTIGRLICIPAQEDPWFRAAGWRSHYDAEVGYDAAEIIAAFRERGGAVVLAHPFDDGLGHVARADAFVGVPGLSAMVVTSSPDHAALNERAAAAARAAGVVAVGGSADAPLGPRFGSSLTLLVEVPEDAAALVRALGDGRLWPLESVAVVESADEDEDDDDNDDDAPPAAAPPSAERAAPGPRAEAKSRHERQQLERQAARQRRTEREDNRGNRLDAQIVRKPASNPFDHRQPDLDPIARLYGLADRRPESRSGHASDDDLDRVNGNRARGPDPNVMFVPDFRELRAERAHVNLLLETIEEQRDDLRESVAMRFALAALEQQPRPASPRDEGGGDAGDARRRRHRRRR